MQWRGWEEQLPFKPSSPLLQGDTVPEKPPSPALLPWGKGAVCEWAPHFLRCVGGCPRNPLLFSPTQNPEVICIAEGLREAGIIATKAKKCFTDSLRKPPISHLGCLTYSPPHWPVGTSNVVCTSTSCPAPYTHHVASSWWMLISVVSESLSRWLQNWEKAHKWAFHGTALGKTTAMLLAPGLVLCDWEKAYNLENPPPRGSKKCEVGACIEKFWESLRIPNWTDWWKHFSLS